MKKRTLSLLMALTLALGTLSGCGGPGSGSSGSAPSPTATPQPVTALDYNPLTGEDKPAGLADGQRPAAVMINNIQTALPQTGIGSADVIYEMPVLIHIKNC